MKQIESHALRCCCCRKIIAEASTEEVLASIYLGKREIACPHCGARFGNPFTYSNKLKGGKNGNSKFNGRGKGL